MQLIFDEFKNFEKIDRTFVFSSSLQILHQENSYDLVNPHMKGNPKDSTYLLRVESGSGVAHSRQSQEAQENISQGNRFNAKNIEFTARGDGSLNEKGEKKLGNINLTHTDITARDETGNRIQDSHLTLTGNEINIQAGEAHGKLKGRSQSVGVEVGMAATVGAQTGVGVYARVGGSSGKEDGYSKTYQASHLEAETVTLNSQGDTNLIGSQAKGKTVNANVGGNLKIESLQDEERFKTKSSGGGLEVEFGFGNNWSLSGYGNASSGKTNHKQVNEQAGIFAEEGGYHVNADNVHLKGGAIASQNPQNSQLSTNKLTFEDIQNSSVSQSISGGISGSMSGESRQKEDSQTTTQTQKLDDGQESSKKTNLNHGINPSLPMAYRSQDSSVTKATLTEGKIILHKDTTPTETTAKDLGINTDITQANRQTATTQDVKAQVAEQQQIATAIGKVRSAAETYAANRRAEAEQVLAQKQTELAIAKAQGNKATEAKLEEQVKTAKTEAENWGTGGTYRQAMDATLNGLGLGLGGFSPEAVAAGVASPYVNTAIKAVADDGTLANLALHGIWGAVEAATQGANVIGGASSAITGEVAAKILAEKLYGQETPENLTEEQKRVVSQLSQVIAGVVSGTAELASGGDAVSSIQNMDVGMNVAKNAVENNGLLTSQTVDLFKKLEKAEKDGNSLEDIFNEAKELSDKQYNELKENCIDSAICRYGAEKLNEESNQQALELVSYFNSKLSSLSEESQTRFIEFIIQENGREIELIEQNRSPVETVIVKLVDTFAEGAQSRGRKISPKIASFAKKVKNPNATNKDWKYIPTPKKEDITGFTNLIKVKDKTPVQGGGKLRSRWKDNEGNIYEWDSQHGALEKYNKKGKHLGEFDYKTGVQTKVADPKRRVEP